jgi:hypothetical protein
MWLNRPIMWLQGDCNIMYKWNVKLILQYSPPNVIHQSTAGGLQQRQGANWTHYVTHYCREVFSTDPLHWCCCTTTLFCSGNESSCKKQPKWQRKAEVLSFLTQVTLKRPPFVSIRVVCLFCLSVCLSDWLTLLSLIITIFVRIIFFMDVFINLTTPCQLKMLNCKLHD